MLRIFTIVQTFQSNSFVLASVFPMFQDVLDTPDPALISIPDLDYADLEGCESFMGPLGATDDGKYINCGNKP